MDENNLIVIGSDGKSLFKKKKKKKKERKKYIA